MQNVVFTNRRVASLGSDATVRAACLNELSGLLYVLDSNSRLTMVQTNGAMLHTTRSVQVEELSKASVVNFLYLVEKEALCLITSDGNIVKIQESGKCEEVASNQDGIQCASWSPSQEHLVLVTNNHSLIQLNSEFDLVSEVPLDDGGDGGKAVGSSISWKADGKFFAVNYEMGEGRKCLTRDVAMGVFKSPSKSDSDQKGLVQSVSDAATKMGELCCWQPAGGLIAGYDNKGPNDSYRVIFWEKNGLRHLQFSLPAFVERVRQLTWSIDSELLYVQVQSCSKRRVLLVYHRANYHWYLKTTLHLNDADMYLVHKQRRNKLILVGSGQVQQLELSLQYSPSEWTSLEREQTHKEAIHYCIDGQVLNITDFSRGIVPPPMSHIQVRLEEPINAAAIRSSQVLLLMDSSIEVYDYKQKQLITKLPNRLQIGRYWDVRLLSTTPALMFSVGDSIYTNGQKNGSTAELPKKQPILIGDISVLAELQNSRLCVNGRVVSEECTSYCLYDRFILFTCNSTGMYQKLFVFNLQLEVWLWNGECQDIPKQLPSDQSKSLSLRMVERGSRIVCCSEGRVVFQLPRGNLQTIFPKVITLHRVKDCIGRCDYFRAFELARTHKLDLNLMFDVNPQQFADRCEQVMQSLSKSDYINLLVASLKEELSDELKYCLPSRQVDAVKEHLATIDSKVKYVCEKASLALRALDKDKYLLSIYTCEVKRGDLAGVLREIKESRQHDKVQQKVPPHLQADKPKRSIGSKEVLEYVCWLADAEVIYKVALLTYDLELVAMAAEFTQKDPKEYVPYLQELRAIQNEVDRRCRICVDMKKYDQALEELAQGNDEQVKRAMSLVKQHSLFNKGVMVFRNVPRHLTEVKRLMAEYLLSKQQINEAITVLESSSMRERAVEVAATHFKIKRMLQLMDTLQIAPAEQRSRVEALIPEMLVNGAEAKQLSRAYEFVGQYESAIKVCIKNGYLHRASTLLKHIKPSFEGELREAAKLAYSLQYNQILKTRRTFQEKQARLLIVQKQKRETPSLQLATKEADEMYSEYSSSHVSQSNYTVSTTTGMKKKKQKVKGILNRNVKEGSPLQEDFLVALLNDTAAKFEGSLKQTKQLIQFLTHVNLLEEAQQLRDEARQASRTVSKRIRPLKQVRYEQLHEEVLSIYPPYQPKPFDAIASFDWLL